MKVFGWILTVIGGIGTIISQIAYMDAEGDYSNRFSSALYGTASNMSHAETSRLICIVILILGVLFLIIGYAAGAKQQTTPTRQMYNGTFCGAPPAARVSDATQVECPSCKNIMDSRFAFCGKCGNSLQAAQRAESFCAKCGQKIGSNHSFCPYCGTKKE